MKAWVIDRICDLTKENRPLTRTELPKPVPSKGEILIRVKTCGICHTEIDEIEGRLAPPEYPVVPGHQAIGIVEQNKGNSNLKEGDRVGVAWIHSACGKCEFCKSGMENLCPYFRATGKDVHGGYADYLVVPERFAYKIPDIFSDAEAAPLLCAGAIGYRSVSLARPENGHRIGLTGFGASAHLVLKLIKYQFPDSGIFVFARNQSEREFALNLGCDWAGDTNEKPSHLMDCIIDTTPVWTPVLSALDFLKPGGRLVINAIRKENTDIENLLQIDYSRHLWMEKQIKTVANVTSSDVKEFIRIATEMPFKPEVELFDFEKANEAILQIKQRKIKGAKVLMIN